MASYRTGLLIIRAWVEEGSTKPLRAQVRLTDDISQGIEQTLTLAEPDTVRDLVDSWIRRVGTPDSASNGDRRSPRP